MNYQYKGKWPVIDETVFVAPDAVITGDVEIGAHSSVWFQAVIRGDVAPVRIGSYTNIQDLSLLHQSPDLPLIVEDHVTIGHQVTLHSAIIRERALIGMGSIILDGAEIGEEAFIGAGSLVPPGKKIPPRTLALGSPARVVRDLTEEDIAEMKRIQAEYAEKAQEYKKTIEQTD